MKRSRKKIHFSRNVAIIIAADLFLLSLGLYVSYLLRFDFQIPSPYYASFVNILPLLLIVKLICFYSFDLYRGMWRYTSIADLFNILKASVLSSLIIVGAILFVNRFEGFPRSVFLIDWLLTVLFIAAFRIVIRFYFEYGAAENGTPVFRRVIRRLFPGQEERRRKNLLIIGAGDCGEKIYREIHNNPSLGYKVLGFLDDNPAKVGMTIHGTKVLGKIAEVENWVDRGKVNELIICIPSATAEQMRTVVSHCEASGVRFKTVPGYSELINGTVSVSAIRDVAYRDLLGREVIHLDKEKIGGYLRQKNILVTGAGGSIGSELCRQLGQFDPARVVLLERAESALYEIHLDLQSIFRNRPIEIIPMLGDIQDRRQLQAVFSRFSPQVVFHAAAYKHVPILEAHPWKAVKNNICGTQNMVEAAKAFGVERFVFVSTDKAVRPTNVMGASKRIAEILLQSQNDGNNPSGTQFMIVRFGNVAGSVGSVIPLFKKQIEKGGPVTVTHPEVTRYFMTIFEACQLILQAGAIGSQPGRSAEVFVLKMGTPIKIVDMAHDLIRLSGFAPGVDIQIEYIGLRPGEKLYEELITDGEGVVPTSHRKIMVLTGLEADLQSLNGKIRELMVLAEKQDDAAIKEKLREIVPEYKPVR